MSNYTKGPWKKANARLIVLNNLTTMIPHNRDLQELGEKACIEALRTAIAKATGGAK